MISVVCAIFAVGVLSGVTALMADMFLDYGNVFDFVRFHFAKRAARRANYYDNFIEQANRIKAVEDFSERMNEMNGLYWKLATKDKLFTSWVCLYCLAIQKICPVYVVCSLFIFSLCWWWLPVLFFFSALTTFTTLKAFE